MDGRSPSAPTTSCSAGSPSTGDLAGAREWWIGARRQGHVVGSPHQVALAQWHLDRVASDPTGRPRPRRPFADEEPKIALA